MTNLTTLMIGASKGGELPDSMGNLVNLQSLVLSASYGFGHYPEDLSGLTSLNTFKLTTTYATYSPYGTKHYNASFLSGLSNLTTFQITSSYNPGFTFIPDISLNTGLKSIIVNGDWTSIPDVFAGMKNLTILVLDSSRYLTKLPPSLSQCTELQTLSCIGCNALTAEDAFFDMTNTKIYSINLRSSGFTKLPSSICQLPTRPFYQPYSWVAPSNDLHIELYYMPIASLPSCLSGNDKITSIVFYNSNFTSFPSIINTFSALKTFSLARNIQALTGSADFSLQPNLTSLDLSYNAWNAPFPALPVPVAPATSTALRTINFGYNKLYGTLPATLLEKQTALTTFDVSYSQLSGPFPSAIGSLSSLYTLYCAGNYFTSIPEAVTKLASLSTIDFSDNLLNSIPSNETQWASMPSLSILYIGGNTDLNGLIPTWWASSKVITQVNMSFTNFHGDFPAINASRLTNAWFSGMQLNGRILGFPNAPKLFSLKLDRNQLTGAIPNNIGFATTGALTLQTLDLSFNMLSGNLPVYFSALVNLQNLYLNNNGFSGVMPNINVMTGISKLQLQNNQFQLCATNPGIPSRLSGSCNATNNAYPNACECASLYTYCAVDVGCPPPGWEPVFVPYSVPTPIKPPSAPISPPPIFIEPNEPTDQPTLAPSDSPSTPVAPTSPPSSSPPLRLPALPPDLWLSLPLWHSFSSQFLLFKLNHVHCKTVPNDTNIP